MNCPKCERGMLKKIVFKATRTSAYLCDVCETFWFDGERITEDSGHAFASYSRAEDIAYTTVDMDEKDQDHQGVVGREMHGW